MDSALRCFETNIKRMQYGTFRSARYFVGSGVVETGYKTVIDGRCKQSGMYWSEPVPATSWFCVVSIAVDAWMNSGNTDRITTPLAMITWPS